MSEPLTEKLSVVMLGATGAVGSHTARKLASLPEIERLALLGRRDAEGIQQAGAGARIEQHRVDVLEPDSYQAQLPGHQIAVCCLGVGQPSKMSREEFVRIDKQAVLDFASGCKQSGVRHFLLLSSVGASSASASFYLRTKGELEDALRALAFERLSLFHPSMILTPTNRYGLSQAATLLIWPHLNPVLAGPLRKFRGIPVAQLGEAIATQVVTAGSGVEVLEWDSIARPK